VHTRAIAQTQNDRCVTENLEVGEEAFGRRFRLPWSRKREPADFRDACEPRTVLWRRDECDCRTRRPQRFRDFVRRRSRRGRHRDGLILFRRWPAKID